MLRDLHGMYHADIQRAIRSKVLPRRFRVVEYVLVKLVGHRFSAEHDLVWDLVCSSSPTQIATAFSEYRRHPSRHHGLFTLVFGAAHDRSFQTYFQQLEREWSARKPGQSSLG